MYIYITRKIFILQGIGIVLILGGMMLPGSIAQAQENRFKEVRRYEGRMANPKTFHVAAPNRVVVVDHARDKAALTLVDLAKGTELKRFAAGRGPGQIRSGQGGYVVMQDPDKSIWVWQQRSRVLSVYASDNLEYLASIRVRQGEDAMAPVNDTLALSLPVLLSTEMNNSEVNTFVQYRRWSRNPYRVSDPIKTIPTSVHSSLEPLGQNIMLRQGHYDVDRGDVFVGFHFSSTVVRLDASGVQKVTSGKEVIPFPDYSTGREGRYEAPDVTKYPPATTDLAVDDQYVYVLHHGRTLNIGTLSRVVKTVQGKMEAAMEEWRLTDRVLVYDRESLSFEREIQLPYRARAIEAGKKHFYILTTDEIPPSIISYSLNIDS